MAQPKIEVRANKIGQIPGSNPYYHSFIVLTDSSGKETYYRAGPENGGGSSAASSGASGSNRTSGSSGSSNRSGFGKIVAESGSYVPGTIDYNTDATVIYSKNLNAEEFARIKTGLTNQVDAVNSAQIDYNPTGPNSNTFVGTATKNVGINFKAPDHIWLPGVDSSLSQNPSGNSSNVATGGNTNIGQTAASDTTSQYDAVIATFSEDGKATGKIKNLSNAVSELKSAAYTSEKITGFLNAYYEKQGVPEAQRAALIAETTDKAGQTSRETVAASTGSGTNRQM
jgi:hypothetical protein